MEGDSRNFDRVLADFEARLRVAEFVAVDTELTGVDIEGEPDSFEESAQERLEKMLRVAERYTLIQIGFTVMGRQAGVEGGLTCASFNLFAFPWDGPELLGQEPGFHCQASALRFNAQHDVDFNRWIKHGVAYMSRADEASYLQTAAGKEDKDLDQKVGLLRLWKALCAARLPLIVHCPLDLFFLLAAFEHRPLPRDERELVALIRRVSPQVYDTAHLHGVVGRFRRLGLTKFFEDAKTRHEQLASAGKGVDPVEFELKAATQERYGKPGDEKEHEAGYDSLITAQLFAYLRAIAPQQVRQAANRLFLYRSAEFLDLDRAVNAGAIGVSLWDLSRVTLLVAELEHIDSNDAPRLISAAGSEYKWMDSWHILVILRASGGAAVRKAAELASKVQGVQCWMPFEEWRATQRGTGAAQQGSGDVHSAATNADINGCKAHSVAISASNGGAAFGPLRRWGRALSAGASVVILLLLTIARQFRSWRQRSRRPLGLTTGAK
eukprot:gnl/TRDRNA2_/TRDRNA2_81684_c0_seq1.p1 gnl/TRDRNA2_/TRDRNA2_81684_c0~~gnl/TRDRNA2_/TRDRNA2_81684_c0_seq1.p1  ORF type:complete len:495 (-),score=93.84 gnl/TRDRNA2_/TRDRNA2_81684_c0_seq1:108-1592(-)